MSTIIFRVQDLINEIEKAFESDKTRGLTIAKRENWIDEKPARKSELPQSVLKKIPENVINIINSKYSGSTSFDVRKDCFSHQVEALKFIFQGKNVAITTPTASGKSLCYQIPILSEMFKSDVSTALLIFPTKALGVDQIDSYVNFGKYEQDWPLHKIDLDGRTIYAGEYTGDVKEPCDQGKVRKYSRILITNPDSIHAKILPYPQATKRILAFKSPAEKESNYSFERFFKYLRYVVLDEIHVYRGVFGANVAYLMRRLRLFCEKLDNTRLQFICCSATINNPEEHARNLFGVPFKVIKEDGAPKYRKGFLLWNPPKKSKGGDDRREATSDALEILEKVIAKSKFPVQTISFLRSVKLTNSFDNKLRGMLERVHSPYRGKTTAFSNPLLYNEKREIQKQIKSGDILFISATSALELGIDIGDLTCCILVGYPGNISSTIQRAGRVGRIGESVIILILNDETLEQYFANYPEVFFKLLENPGEVKIPMGNKYLLAWHLKCALWESKTLGGYSDNDYQKYFDVEDILNLFKELGEEGKLFKENRIYWIAKGCGESHNTLHGKGIRIPISNIEFSVKDKKTGYEIAKIDYYRSGLFFHEGAIWLQNGKYYQVTKYSRPEALIEVEHLLDDPGYETQAIPRHTVKIIKERFKSKGSNMVSLHYGDVTNTRSINIFLKKPLKEKSKVEVGIISSVEAIEYDTTATWIAFNDQFVKSIYSEVGSNTSEDCNKLFETGLHGLALLLTSAIPILTECDRYDISSQAFVPHRDSGKPTLFLLDTFHGGVDLSKEVFEQFSRLISLCEKMLDMPEKLVTFFISEEKIKEIEKGGKTPKPESLGEPVVVDKEIVKRIITHIKRNLI